MTENLWTWEWKQRCYIYVNRISIINLLPDKPNHRAYELVIDSIWGRIWIETRRKEL